MKKKNKRAVKLANKTTSSNGPSFIAGCLHRAANFIKSRLFFESSGILLTGCSVFLVIALATLRVDGAGNPVSHCGKAGALIAGMLVNGIGVLSLSVPIVLAVFGLIFFRYRTIEHKLLRFVGFILFVAAAAVIMSHLKPNTFSWSDIPHSPGGRLGDHLVMPLQNAFGDIGTTIFLLSFTLISITFLTGLSYNNLISKSFRVFMQASKKVFKRLAGVLNNLRQQIAENKKRKKALKSRRRKSAPSDAISSNTGKNDFQRPEIAGPDIDIIESSQEFGRGPHKIQVVDMVDGHRINGDDMADSEEMDAGDEHSSSDFSRSLAYESPDISLFDDRPAGVEKESHTDIITKSEKLVAKLKEFNVEGRITEVCPGPVITRYEFEPAPGVKIAKVSGLADDLALGMRSRFGLRVAPIPGKSTLGIELPNTHREVVNLKDVLLSEEFQRACENSILSLPLGKDTSGRPFITDLKRMPHLLIAGATGSGKSVCINTLLAGLLFVAKPEQLRLLLIDPKMLELSDFNGIPHLREPVITDTKLAPDALNWAVSEMERRYRLLSEHGSRNIDLFNTKVTSPDYDGDLKPLPYLVIVIDELADLMLTAAASIEDAIQRLSQMARAAGIHLIIATQRPSVDVITGVIKANLPCRLAFQVASRVDSRTILDGIGAEKLIGMGDSIFVPPGRSQFVRIHGAYVNENEIRRLVSHLARQPSADESEESIFDFVTPQNGDFDEIDDPIYDDAVRLVLTSGVASISMLQRRLKVGHSRASRLIDTMELSGIVGPHIGSKTREILVEPEEYLERMNEIRETGAYD